MAGIAGPPGLGAVAVATMKPCSPCDSRAHRGVGFIYIFCYNHGLSNPFASAIFRPLYNVSRAQSRGMLVRRDDCVHKVRQLSQAPLQVRATFDKTLHAFLGCKRTSLELDSILSLLQNQAVQYGRRDAGTVNARFCLGAGCRR